MQRVVFTRTLNGGGGGGVVRTSKFRIAVAAGIYLPAVVKPAAIIIVQ